MAKQQKKKRKIGQFGTWTTGISTTLVLLLLGIVVLFVSIGTNYSRQIREELTVCISLNDSISPTELKATQTRLQKAPYTRMLDYISKERGTREMNEALQSDMVDFIGFSPIPAEFEVYLKANYANLDSLTHYEKSMRALPGVADVSYPKDLMRNLDRIIPTVGLILLGIAGLLSIISFSLINNSIRMNVYSKRFSIHTMKLVGASWGFIRRPFIAQAFYIGFTSALMAGAILGGILYYLQFIVEDGNSYFNQLITPWVWIATLGIVFAAGILFTIWCAFISISHHLRMNTSQVYLR